MKKNSIVVLKKNHFTLDNLRKCGNKVPVPNEYYTVRSMEIDEYTGINSIRLEEIVNPVNQWNNGQLRECRFLEPLFQEVSPPDDLSKIMKIVNSQT